MSPPTRSSDLGDLLRGWRRARGLSQLELALAAEVSSRHLSFVETGRSHPSREMVLRLAEALELPLRERNRGLFAAGFAPLYGEGSLAGEELSLARRALERILVAHQPYPAFVVDSTWRVVLANATHRWMLAQLLPELATEEPVNVMRLVLDPDLLRLRVVNWNEVAHVLGHRIQRSIRGPGARDALRTELGPLLALPGVREAMNSFEVSPEADIVLPLVLDVHGTELAWFSTIAALGTPRDVTLDELAIECLFPADEGTRAWIEAQAPRTSS